MALVILDRDGVINEDSDAFIKRLDEWIPLPGSIDAIARLSRGGYSVAVATNQSGLGRGLFGIAELEAMHRRLLQLVIAAGGMIDGIYYCPHRPDEGCTPSPETWASPWPERRWWGTACGIWRRASPGVAPPTWCAPVRAPQRRRSCKPSTARCWPTSGYSTPSPIAPTTCCSVEDTEP